MNKQPEIHFSATVRILSKFYHLLPTIWFIGLTALAVRTRFLIGRWPTYSKPDPKDLPFELHHMALWIGLILLALIGIVDLAGLIIQLTIGPRDIPKKKILVFFIPYLVFFAVVYFHPFLHGNWIEWFLD